jgi:hypothetical protein
MNKQDTSATAVAPAPEAEPATRDNVDRILEVW